MKVLVRILVILLPLALAGLGAASAPALALMHERVWFVHQRPWEPSEPATDARKAFLQSQKARATPTTDDQMRDELLAEAAAIVGRFRVGGALLGGFVGLVVSMKIAASSRVPHRTEYEIERSLCVVCARCFRYCPRERQRRRATFGQWASRL